MICDENGVIIKLDDKSVIGFLRENRRPLVIYGMGKKGQFTIEAMDKLNIMVSMVVDSDKRKQGSIIMGRKIFSIDEAQKGYPDAIVWITIADVKIRLPIEKKVHELGFSLILTFDLQDPVSEEAYIDIEENFPYLLVGKNKYTDDLQDYLIQKKHKIIGIGENVSAIERMCNDFEDINIIICDDKLWTDTVFWLHDHGIYENIYLYLRGDFGVFKIEKYRFLSTKLRYIFRIFFASLNGMNQQMIDEDSKKYFQEINYHYVYYLIKNKSMLMEEEKACKQLAELRHWMLTVNNNKMEKVFQTFSIDLRENIIDTFPYLNFLSKMYEYCICYQKKISVQKKNDYTFEVCQEIV